MVRTDGIIYNRTGLAPQAKFSMTMSDMATQAPGEVYAPGGASVQGDAQLVGVGVPEMAVGVEIGRKALGGARSRGNVGAPEGAHTSLV